MMKQLGVIVAAGAAVIALAGTALASTREVLIPMTYGLRASVAISDIERAGFAVTTNPARNPACTYTSIGALPRGGTYAPRGSHVTLNVVTPCTTTPPITPPPPPPPPPPSSGPALPSGVTGTFVSQETGAQLYADSGWQKSSNGQIEPASNCGLWAPATISTDGTNLDLYTPGTTSWDCAAIESNAAVAPGHIWQLSEYIPAQADGDIAGYPSWWLTNAAWSSEVDMAEAEDWGGISSPYGYMCLDIHLNQGTENTSPNCHEEAGGWHTYTLVWALDGKVTMYYDGTEVDPQGVSGTTATDMHMIIWNNNNGGTVNSTVQVAYLAEWDL